MGWEGFPSGAFCQMCTQCGSATALLNSHPRITSCVPIEPLPRGEEGLEARPQHLFFRPPPAATSQPRLADGRSVGRSTALSTFGIRCRFGGHKATSHVWGCERGWPCSLSCVAFSPAVLFDGCRSVCDETQRISLIFLSSE